MAGSNESPTYAFGDSDLAADRLALVAEVFGPTSAALLADASPPSVDLAIDLGCGPGYTTRLVADHSRATRTVGLDASAAFVERARREHGAAADFVVHDVTRLPFPVSGADLVYGRYLLAHLPNPPMLVDRWSTQLRPGGRLVLEEVEEIATDDVAFARYLEIVTDLLASRNTDLYVGRTLRDASAPTGSRLVMSRAGRTAPATGQVAAMFAMNLVSWRDEPWIVDNIDADELVELALQVDARRPIETRGAIVWTHRQVVYERVHG